MKHSHDLLGPRLRLRGYRKEDLDFATGMWFHPENGKFLSDPTADHVDEIFRKALDNLEDSPHGYYFILEDRQTCQPIGTGCAFPGEDGRVFDIGYCVHASHRGKGYGTETVRLLIAFVREQGGEAVTAEVADGNPASTALLKKAGFQSVSASQFRKYGTDTVFPSHIYRLDLK